MVSTNSDGLIDKAEEAIRKAASTVYKASLDGSGNLPAGWTGKIYTWEPQYQKWLLESCYTDDQDNLRCTGTIDETAPSSVPTTPPAPIAPMGPLQLQIDHTTKVQASGFAPGEPVTATLHSRVYNLGTVRADPDGRVSFAVRPPPGITPGDHELLLTGLSSHRVVTIPVLVIPANVTSTLASTGLSALPLLLAATVALLGGSILILTVRRPRIRPR